MLSDESILTLVDKLKKREIKPQDILLECLENIKKFNPQINAFITQTEPRRESYSSAKSLSGIPYTLKDSYVTRGIQTTAASKVLANYLPGFNATVVNKLNSAGAVLLGKMNMDAWGHGGSTENTDYGPTKNPWSLNRVAGGSGGGPAAAIASRMCLFAISEDTGGSIRNPAGWCNITGLKVTYGRVSRYGCIAYASSLDTVGPTAKSAEDCAAVLSVIAGHDPFDATSSPEPVSPYLDSLQTPIKGIRLGIPREFFEKGIDPEVKKLVMKAASDFESLGVHLVPISLPMLEYAVAIYYLIAPSETSSNLGRYDGIRYGQGRHLFTQETMRRIMIGTFALSSGYIDAYYRKALQARTLIIEDYKKAFTVCDAILSPISPTTAPKFKELLNDPVKNMMADIYAVTANTAGIPSLALPGGFTKENLPVGFQLQGKMFAEHLLLRLGYQYQQVTDWHTYHPPIMKELSTLSHKP